MLQQFIHFGDVFVGELLDLLFAAAGIVFRHFFVFQQFFDVIVGIAAHVADRHAAVFGFAAHYFNQVFAALFSEHRHRHADKVAHRSGVQAEVGIADGFFHGGGHIALIGLHADGARVEQGYVGHLAHRHHAAVVFHFHLVEQTGVGTAGAHFG